MLISLLLALHSPPPGAAQPEPLQAMVGQQPVRVRLGPGYNYPALYALDAQSPVQVFARSADQAWFYLRYSTLEGWVAADGLLLDANLSLPIQASPIPEPDLSTDPCISLVGDSVPYGDVVYEVPGHGFGVLRTKPVSEILQEALQSQGLGYLEVRDRSSSAAFLSAEGKFPYVDTPQYSALLNDRCRFSILMPWVNDLSVSRDEGAAAHISDLNDLLEALQAASPDTELLILNFYYGQRADFVANYAPGYTVENIAAHNAALELACAEAWRQNPQVHCLKIDDYFEDDLRHVVQQRTRSEVEATLYEPIPADVRPFFEAYWRDQPDGEVLGDGVHLSEDGKAALAALLVETMLWINPKL